MSVARVMGILEHVANGQAPVALSDLSRALAAPKASLLSLLGELMAQGFLRRDDDGRYLLGSRAYRLAARVSASGSLSRSVRNTLADISRELQATVSLGYLDVASRALVYVDRYGENSAVRYLVKYGPATHIHSRATGKLLVSLQPEATWAEWFGPEPYEAVTPRTLTRFVQLRKDLLAARDDQVAFTLSEQYEGISGCSVPVLGDDGVAAAGIGILMIGESMERNRKHVLQVMRQAATSLSEEFKLRRITAATISANL